MKNNIPEEGDILDIDGSILIYSCNYYSDAIYILGLQLKTGYHYSIFNTRIGDITSYNPNSAYRKWLYPILDSQNMIGVRFWISQI